MLQRVVRWARRLIRQEDVTSEAEPRMYGSAPVTSATLELPEKAQGVAASGFRTIAALNANQSGPAAPAKTTPPSTRPIDAATAAAEFVTRGQTHRPADQDWPVDGVWFLGPCNGGVSRSPTTAA